MLLPLIAARLRDRLDDMVGVGYLLGASPKLGALGYTYQQPGPIPSTPLRASGKPASTTAPPVAQATSLSPTRSGARRHASGRRHGVTVGPDGNIWFVESDVGKIGRISP
jgi:hypothetical protein